MKICSELQFLCLLCSCANKQGHNPLSYIANIFHKRGQSLNSEEQQISMFDEVDHNPNMVYDRIILNLVDFPKNNPHFFLINQINSQHNDLKDDGLLFVLSSKKLFVPSQSEKVEQLLNKFKLEFVLGLDGIKNKGELASYIYVFRKTKLNTEESQDSFFLSNEEFGPFSSSLAMAKKSSCYSFRFSGDLSCYQKFNSFVEEINHFFSNKRVDSTPIYQSEFGDGFTIEFYQDAVVDGKLINSTKDPSHITHPNFFKNLMKSCIPLDYFFQIEPLSPGEESREGQLGLSFRKHDQYPYLLIVDFRNTHQVQLELTRIEAYEAKKEEYGNALCFYYGLISKRTDININLFREYLNSKLGLQLIQLSLYGKMSKLKSRLNEILIPKFFSESLRLPKHIEDSLVYFSYAEENLLQMHPQELENNFNKLTPTISSLWQKYPWSVMGLLSYFRMKLQNIQGKLINTKEKSGINYNSALIRDQIIKAPTSPIFPNNAEIYTEFKFKFQHEINLPLTEIILSNRDSQGEILYFLELQNSGKTIVELHSELVLLNFIKFILTNSLNIPISQLLQSLRIPSAKTLRILFSSIEGTQSIFTELEKRTHGLIENLINSQISIFEEKKKEINNQDSDKDCIFWS